MALAALEEVLYFKAKEEDIKNKVEEADLLDVEEVDMVVTIEEEESIGAVDKMLEWYNVMTYQSWGFIRHMISLTMNGTGYLR